MTGWAVIFDVDGVLLELTRAEEELFFQPFARRMDASVLSRDWNSYTIRNDEEIVKEIVGRHGLAPAQADTITEEYLNLLEGELASGRLQSMPIPGAADLLAQVQSLARLGIATANFRRAAELRLRQAQMWAPVSPLAFGADGGGAKADILARAMAVGGLAPQTTIFIGDNVNDVVAGLQNKVNFIGFSIEPQRRAQLAAAGARHLAASHEQTINILKDILVR